jgi:hypothetical protein
MLAASCPSLREAEGQSTDQRRRTCRGPRVSSSSAALNLLSVLLLQSSRLIFPPHPQAVSLGPSKLKDSTTRLAVRAHRARRRLSKRRLSRPKEETTLYTFDTATKFHSD